MFFKISWQFKRHFLQNSKDYNFAFTTFLIRGRWNSDPSASNFWPRLSQTWYASIFFIFLQKKVLDIQSEVQKDFFWVFACGGRNSRLISAGRGCVEAGPVSPVNIDRFEFFKRQNAQNKKWNGVNFMTFFVLRSNRGRYKTEADSRPDLYLLWLLTDSSVWGVKWRVFSKRIFLYKTFFRLEVN